MKKSLHKFIRPVNLIPLFLLLNSACCSPLNLPIGPQQSALSELNIDEILSKDRTCTNLVEDQINAWQSRDIEYIKQIYTDDIVHFDGYPAYVGFDEVVDLAERMWMRFSKWEMKAGEVYISKNECVGEWINWNVLGIPQDSPGMEFDLINFRDDKISFWRLFYDQKFWEIFNEPHKIDNDFLNQFASTWSGGIKKEIKQLYSRDAVYEDTLFNISHTGSNNISIYASSYFDQFPQAKWTVMHTFAERKALSGFKDDYPFASQGALFEITLQGEDTEPCQIRAVIILTPNHEKQIIKQQIFYDAESIVECGLAK